jgi:hypothetical protein
MRTTYERDGRRKKEKRGKASLEAGLHGGKGEEL